ncbi:hypothetical protein [Enterococcus faecalis]|uniref:Type VII secretion effector n=1 Tax=Enterococcus faecalis RP2S-4 TaxID=1244145 RepID=A0ABC9TJM4_ENTFL|nr:hypothetical protein [Enterococcus faecalis]EPI09172.1 hypothetical protein D358_01263 [Enterococcus faecalis RP2S-4]
MVKVTSNQGAAQAAVSGISNVSVSGGQKCMLGKSNISSIKKGSEIGNKMLNDLTKFVSSVNTQANKFPKLAAVIAARDSQTKF